MTQGQGPPLTCRPLLSTLHRPLPKGGTYYYSGSPSDFPSDGGGDPAPPRVSRTDISNSCHGVDGSVFLQLVPSPGKDPEGGAGESCSRPSCFAGVIGICNETHGNSNDHQAKFGLLQYYHCLACQCCLSPLVRALSAGWTLMAKIVSWTQPVLISRLLSISKILQLLPQPPVTSISGLTSSSKITT